MNFEALCRESLDINTVRIVQNIILERYMSARFKQGSVGYRSFSTSGHKGKVILPYNEGLYSQNVTPVFGGNYWRRI